MTKIALFAILLAATVRNHPGLERPASEAELLRAYAWAECIATAYEKTPFGADAERSANVYLEGGHAASEAYSRVRRAIPHDLDKPSPYDGQNYALMKCLEFYESPDLKALSRRLVGQGGK
ncbi:MAG TPA: T6SS amidase immunity protein Tai4 family protein [Polyangia bacterium]|nr:T6SS amidase immunity protein Tai4 family protein [Polyangia bacterium]